MKTRLLIFSIITYILFFVITFTVNPVSALCDFDSSDPNAPCDDLRTFLILNSHESQIEILDGKLFYVIGPFPLEQESNDRIRLDDVTFTYPSYPNPPTPGGPVSVTITFENGAKERIFKVGAPSPFIEFVGVDPQAGVRRNADGTFNYLLSVEQQLISPLKQFKSGVPIDEIQCRESLTLITKYDGSPACVNLDSITKLIERKWIKNECARLFDSNMIKYSNHVKEQKEKGVVWTPPTREGLLLKSDYFEEWRDYGCIETINDWKHLSDNVRFLKNIEFKPKIVQ